MPHGPRQALATRVSPRSRRPTARSANAPDVLQGALVERRVGSVQEEDCDGLCWLYILNEDGIRPDCVVITEPSGLRS